MRVMLDTNVLTSMVFFPSKISTRFASLLADYHEVIICDFTIKTLRFVAQKKFPQKAEQLERFLVEFPFERVHTPRGLDMRDFPEVRNKRNAPILATAILEGADVFVSGDKDMLMADVDEPRVMTMTEFIEEDMRYEQMLHGGTAK